MFEVTRADLAQLNALALLPNVSDALIEQVDWTDNQKNAVTALTVIHDHLFEPQAIMTVTESGLDQEQLEALRTIGMSIDESLAFPKVENASNQALVELNTAVSTADLHGLDKHEAAHIKIGGLTNKCRMALMKSHPSTEVHTPADNDTGVKARILNIFKKSSEQVTEHDEAQYRETLRAILDKVDRTFGIDPDQTQRFFMNMDNDPPFDFGNE